ncbi:hypothetical protein ABZ883_32270 [Streptomyces sp. NPDC046977]|uniref:hypothetical protein n=1 Tax=Streptomyces sp. NPDC046977 TaxID=3154703 RepID=UPI0033EF259E
MRRYAAAVAALAAMAAVPGCVTVSEGRPGAPLPASVPSRPPGTVREVPVVQAPLLEALTTVPPERFPSSPAPRTHRPAVPAAPQRHRAPAAPAPPPRRTSVPAAPRAGDGADVCAWGERYGGWAAGGDAARICRDTYGR